MTFFIMRKMLHNVSWIFYSVDGKRFIINNNDRCISEIKKMSYKNDRNTASRSAKLSCIYPKKRLFSIGISPIF